MNEILINLLPVGMFSTYPDIVPIMIGASGAQVYSLNNKYMLKYTQRDKTDDNIWKSCIREYEFFSTYKNSSYIPEICYMSKTENRVVIIMKKYNSLSRPDFNDDLMEAIIELLTDINTTPFEDILKKPDDSGETGKAEIAFCVRNWHNILDEHNGYFDINVIDEIAAQINRLMLYPNTLPAVLSHGDFHFNNILKTDRNTLVVCDWQNAGIGNASDDLFFFISRASADGLKINEDKAISLYCALFAKKSSQRISKDNILCSMAKSNLGLGFYCWHEYLHNTSKERVEIIYNKMAEAFYYIKANPLQL